MTTTSDNTLVRISPHLLCPKCAATCRWIRHLQGATSRQESVPPQQLQPPALPVGVVLVRASASCASARAAGQRHTAALTARRRTGATTRRLARPRRQRAQGCKQQLAVATRSNTCLRSQATALNSQPSATLVWRDGCGKLIHIVVSCVIWTIMTILVFSVLPCC